jgi:hypothetical protein
VLLIGAVLSGGARAEGETNVAPRTSEPVVALDGQRLSGVELDRISATQSKANELQAYARSHLAETYGGMRLTDRSTQVVMSFTRLDPAEAAMLRRDAGQVPLDFIATRSTERRLYQLQEEVWAKASATESGFEVHGASLIGTVPNTDEGTLDLYLDEAPGARAAFPGEELGAEIVVKDGDRSST